MLNKFIESIVDDNLTWFFKKDLRHHYDRRREDLQKANQSTVTIIDYILQNYVDPKATYPVESIVTWLSYLFNSSKSDKNQIIKHILIVYLKLDIGHYLSQKETTTSKIRTRTKDKTELASIERALDELSKITEIFDFKGSIVHLATGLWAVDNTDFELMIASLGNPSLNLEDYFDSPGHITKLIVDCLVIHEQPRLALFISRIHKYEMCFEEFDRLYCSLLINCSLLSEALKYERAFIEDENYRDILDQFYELGSECDVIKSIKCLNLSEEEEEVLNQHLSVRSTRPVTPMISSQQQTRQSNSMTTPSTKHKPRNRNMQNLQRKPSFNDSPARNTRSARKKN